LRERPGGMAFHQLGPVPDTEAISRRILRETHRAALGWGGVGLLRRLRGASSGAFSPSVRTLAARRLFRLPSTAAPEPCRHHQCDGEHHQSSDGPGHLGIVQDRQRPGP
jgi:hypothetical protein